MPNIRRIAQAEATASATNNVGIEAQQNLDGERGVFERLGDFTTTPRDDARHDQKESSSTGSDS